MTGLIELADRLAILHQHSSPGGRLRNCSCPVCPDLRAAAQVLHRIAVVDIVALEECAADCDAYSLRAAARQLRSVAKALEGTS